MVIAGDGPFAQAACTLLHSHAETVEVALGDVSAVEGAGCVRRVVLASGEAFDTEALAIDSPRAPSYELAVQAGAQVSLDPERGWVPACDATGRAGPALWCFGECAGAAFSPTAFLAAAKPSADAIVSELRRL